jgi:hypothetical protein
MRRLIAALMILVLALIPNVAFARTTFHPPCSLIGGTFIGQAHPTPYGFDSYVVELSGGLSGPAPGTRLTAVTVRSTSPDGTIIFTEDGIFNTTRFGTLQTAGNGVIHPSGQVIDVLQVIRGGSGFVVAYGTANIAAGTIDVSYAGRICPA